MPRIETPCSIERVFAVKVKSRCPTKRVQDCGNSLDPDAKGDLRALTQLNDSTPATKRKSTGKRLRFEVFKRDYFTCRYCGVQPPDCILVADHVVPVVEGGQTTLDNLITSCEVCNQGKAARSLGAVPPRTDADLLYLTTQQEIVEMRRYQEAVAERDRVLSEIAGELTGRFNRTAGAGTLKSAVVVSLLGKYDIEIVGEVLDDVAGKVAGGYVKYWKCVPYIWGVARNVAAERDD